MTILNNVLLFLIEIIFSFYIAILLLRIILQIFRANFKNPICQFIAKLTNPLVSPLKSILPRITYIDLASVIVLLLVECLKFVIRGLIIRHAIYPPSILIIGTVGDIVIQTINIFFYAIIAKVLISWLSPQQHNALTEILYILTEPILSRARKVVPIISGIDFSPLFILICLEIVAIIILSSLPTIA